MARRRIAIRVDFNSLTRRGVPVREEFVAELSARGLPAEAGRLVEVYDEDLDEAGRTVFIHARGRLVFDPRALTWVADFDGSGFEWTNPDQFRARFMC